MKYVAVVANLNGEIDSHGEILSENFMVFGPLPVTFEFQGPSIGTATVRQVGNKILAEIEIDDPIISSETLLDMYGVVGGRVMKTIGHVVTEWALDSVGLTSSPSDKTLTKLKKADL